jgi:hypothetical protein
MTERRPASWSSSWTVNAVGSRLGFLTEWTVTADDWSEDEQPDVGLRHTCGVDPLPELGQRYTLAELVAAAEAHRCPRG